MANNKSRILIIRNDRIGDMVLTLSAITALRKEYPQSRLYLLCSKSNREVAQLLPFDIDLIEDRGFKANIKKLKNLELDIGIDFVNNWRGTNAVQMFLSKIKKRAGFYGLLNRAFLNTGLKAKKDVSLLKQSFMLLKKLGINRIERYRQELNIPDTDIKVDIVVHPGGYYPSQKWPVEYYINLMEKIKNKTNKSFCVIGVTGEKDIIGKIREKFSNQIYLIDEPIKKIAAVMKKAELFIGNNSGPLHLASMIGIKTVSFIGPTNPDVFYPQGENDYVFREELDCIGCGRGECGHHSCMKEITPDKVWEKIRKLIL